MAEPQATRDASPRTTRLLLCLVALPLCLTSLTFLLYSIRIIPKHQKLLASYKSAPGCIPGARSSVASSPCVFVTEKVAGKRYQHNSKDPDDHYLTLQPITGASHEVTVLGNRLWEKAVVGSTVITKNWHGEVVTVKAFGYETMTPANPYYGSRGDSSDIPLMSLFTAFFGLIFVVGWKSSSPKKSDE